MSATGGAEAGGFFAFILTNTPKPTNTATSTTAPTVCGGEHASGASSAKSHVCGGQVSVLDCKGRFAHPRRR